MFCFSCQNLIMKTLRSALIEDENADKFLVDGFPRSFEQAEEFQSEVRHSLQDMFFNITVEVFFVVLSKP